MWRKIEFKIFLWLFVLLNIYRLAGFWPWAETLYHWSSTYFGLPPNFFTALVGLSILANVGLIFSRSRSISAVLAWVLHISLCYFNPMVVSPDTGLTGYFYLFIFVSQNLSSQKNAGPLLFASTYFLTSNMYLVAGIKKFLDDDWRLGKAVKILYDQGYFNAPAFLTNYGILSAITCLSVYVYLLFPVGLVSKKFFIVINSMALIEHIFIFMFMNLRQVSSYYIWFHAFLFFLGSYGQDFYKRKFEFLKDGLATRRPISTLDP